MSVRAAVTALTPGRRTLPADTSHYVCRVLRMREGDRFVAFDSEARTEAEATIELASPEAASVLIGAISECRVQASIPLVIIYGLAKGDKVDAVVRDATELGATQLIIARCTRSIAKVDERRADQKVDRWKRIVEQAARQCGRSDPPNVEGVVDWSVALEIANQYAQERYCLWENATIPLADSLVDAIQNNRSLAFAIGPEGGLTEREVGDAKALGYLPASLGPFVLRTETVAAAVLGAVRILSFRTAQTSQSR